MTSTRSLSGSAELLDRAVQVSPGGVHTSIRRIDPQINFARAEGAYMYDVDGNEYIDYQAAFGGAAFAPGVIRVDIVTPPEKAAPPVTMPDFGAVRGGSGDTAGS